MRNVLITLSDEVIEAGFGYGRGRAVGRLIILLYI